MRSALSALALSLTIAVLVAGCGGGGGGSAMPSSGPPSAGEGEAEGGRVFIDIRDLEFQPAEATVPAGATVVFTNSDQVSHSVTKETGVGPDFDSGPLEPGSTFSQVFSDKGEVEIVDTQRPETTLSITVE